jgi:hypothetical protein
VRASRVEAAGRRASDAGGWLADPIRAALAATDEVGRRYRAVIEDGAPPA